MRPVLRQTLVAGFNVVELALEDPERMLDLGPSLRDDPVDLFVDLIQLIALGCLAHVAPEGIAVFREESFSARMDIALVSPDEC